MNCPGCGAAMRLVSNRGYFRCAYCDRYHFPAETGDDGVCPLGQPTDLDCPVCQTALQTALIDGEPVNYCPSCRGFLAALDAFGRIVTKRRANHGPHERVATPFDPAELERRCLCPVCSRRMEAHPFGGGGNAVVDTCGRCHAVWLDAGELAILERHVPVAHRIEAAVPLAAVLRPDARKSDHDRPSFDLTDLF